MAITKVTQNGAVYARQQFGDGRSVLEKLDPRVVHNAPATVASGTALDLTFSIVDFDGEARDDSGGALLLDIAGTTVSLPFTNGAATLHLHLFALVAMTQRAPYFCDARMEPSEIEVAP